MKLAAHLPSRSSLAMAALTLAMHGALVAAWQRLPHASAASDNAQAVQVRLVSAQEAGRAAAIVQDQAEQTAQSTSSGEDAGLSAVAFVPESGPATSSPARADRSPLQRASNEWAYLPASQLDQRPAPLGVITLPFPDGENLPRGMSVTAVLVLYVSADGAVDRIEFAQSGLPAAFARTAVESFAHVRMRPGMKDGKPRRAMMKIEVEFEAPVASRLVTNAVLESSRSWQAGE